MEFSPFPSPTMPANQASAPPLSPFDDDDEDDFGEFEFVVTPSSLPPPLHPNGHYPNHQPQQQEPPSEGGRQDNNEDEWGDFVESPLQSHPSKASNPLSRGHPPPSSLFFFDPFPASFHNPASFDPDPIQHESVIPATNKSWEKPSGALPLSIFGEEEEPDSLSPPPPPPPPFDVVFSPSKPPMRNGPGFGPGEGIKDLIADLYGMAHKIGSAGNNNGVAPDSAVYDADDGFDESSWEFKDALSDSRGGDPSAGQVHVKREEMLAEISGIEKKATLYDGGIQVVGNRCENIQGASPPSRVHNAVQDWVDMFSARDGLENGFDVGSSVVRCNGCISDLYHETKHINTENGLNPNLANGHSILDENCWEFKGSSLDIEIASGQQIEQKVAGHSSTKGNSFASNAQIQDTGISWENNLEDLSESTFINRKQDLDGPSEVQDGISCECTYLKSGRKDLNSGSVLALNDLISNLYEANQTSAVDSTQSSTENGQDSAESVLNAHIVKGYDHLNESHWELRDAVKDQICISNMIDAHNNISTKTKLEVFVDFYSSLKEKSYFVALCHLDDLKKAHQIAALSGEEAKAEDLDQEIQAVYAKLQVVGEKAYMAERQPKDVSINKLLRVRQEPCFQALELEYHLSEKLSLAVKDLSSAVWLFEHAILGLHILKVASCEEQHTYIITWSKMVSACAKELQHGATIWAQSLEANVHTQILSESRGRQYFVALGEIYRVAEVLRASFTLYKPWMLTSPADSMDILTSLEKCTSAWMDSGLRNALERISDGVGLEHKGMIKDLLESIKFIHDLNFIALQNYVSRPGEPICRLSLLPLSTLQDMEAVAWSGEHYFLKLANLWANRVSHDPSQLPHIHGWENGTG